MSPLEVALTLAVVSLLVIGIEVLPYFVMRSALQGRLIKYVKIGKPWKQVAAELPVYLYSWARIGEDKVVIGCRFSKLYGLGYRQYRKLGGQRPPKRPDIMWLTLGSNDDVCAITLVNC